MTQNRREPPTAAPETTPMRSGPDRGRRVPPTPALPERIADYRLMEPIGAGGMGVVYLAEQEGPLRRRVALKLIRPGAGSDEVLARFEVERQALALMNHECIARVYDAGTTQAGQPYFVMEYVDGTPINRYCEDKGLTIEERLELFARVCDGVQHAHQKAIIHRDLKPSNILVTDENGVPVPKIIDFGVAKAVAQRLSEETLITEQGQWIGTLEYMSPEQAEFGGDNVDTRTDVYSLGVVLYELLSGVLPFESGRLRSASLIEVYRLIRETDPPKPSTRLRELSATGPAGVGRTDAGTARILSSLRGDLDWITMKALEKDRNRRYATAADLGRDIRNFLLHEPVTARPPSTRYVLEKLARRHRAPLVAAAAALVAVMGAAILSTVLYFRAEREAARALLEEERSARVKTLLEDMLQGAGPAVALGRDTQLLREILETAAARIDAATGDHPLVRADVLAVIGKTYADLGEYDTARPFTERALALRRAERGPEHPEALESSAQLGLLQYRLGDMAAAESTLTWTAARQEAVLGAEHPATLTSRTLLAETLVYVGRLDEAIALGSATLEALRRVEGDSSAVTLQGMFAMAQAYTDTDRFPAAESLYTELLELQAKRFGREHPYTLSTAVSLGWMLRLAQRQPEAESLTRRTLDSMRRILGNDHSETMVAVNNIGIILNDLGRTEEAEPYYIESYESSIRVLGEEHPESLAGMVNLATFYVKNGRPSRGEPILDRAIPIFERVLPGSMGHGIAHVVRGDCRASEGRHAAAVEDFRAGQPILSALLPPDHPRLQQLDRLIAASEDALARHAP